LTMNTGLRKKSEKPIPPAAGGFAFVRLFAAALAVLLASVLLAVPSSTGRGAFAQTSPGSKTVEQDTLVKDIVTLDSEISGITGRLEELQGKSEALSEKISGLDEEVTSRRRKLASKRRALADRARNMYVNGRSNTLVMLFSSGDISEFFERNEYVQKVNRRDTDMVVSVKQEANDLEAALTELKRRKKEVDDVAAELESRKERLSASRSERAELLASAGAQAPQLQEQSQRVESKMQQVNQTAPNGKHTGRFLTMVATGYSPEEPGLSDATASGLKAQRGVVAVDPRVIPLGTRVHVEGYGYAIAADTGSAIKGMRIDLCFDTLAECNAYGKRTVQVEILD
jgi:3D (Asp-Asp-Asp) domain-containing protein